MHRYALTLMLVPLLAFGAEPEAFDSGARAFEAARRELLESYLKADLTEADLYRAAVQGMLAADPAMQKYNALLSPSQFAELNAQLKGEVVGIGVRFKLDGATGRAEVLGIIPGSPAAKTDLRAGDVILTVDGAGLKGKQLADAMALIRGKAGEKVTLGLLRDTALITRTLERQKIAVEQVTLELLPGDVALLAVRGFSEATPGQVRAALARAGAAKGLIVDLRENEGGAWHAAVDTVKLLLPKGATLAKMVRRDGKEEVTVADAEPAVKALPAVVLISGHTGSSGEMAAAAVRDALKAPLIGTRTRGKWSVQQLKELPNRFVMKYTVAMFKDPGGKSWDGEGLPPDIEVAMDEETCERAARAKSAAERVAIDPQLRAATSFLRLR